MACWQQLPAKESNAKQQAISEMRAKAYEAQVDQSMADIKAYGKTREGRAFAKARAKAEATKEKAKSKSKSKGEEKAKLKAKPKAKAKITDAKKISRRRRTL